MTQMVEGVQRTREIIAQKSWDELRGHEVNPGAASADPKELQAWIRANAGTGYHAVSTCRMGTDERAVTDSEGRAQGIEGLCRFAFNSGLPHFAYLPRPLRIPNTRKKLQNLAESLVRRFAARNIPGANQFSRALSVVFSEFEFLTSTQSEAAPFKCSATHDNDPSTLM